MFSNNCQVFFLALIKYACCVLSSVFQCYFLLNMKLQPSAYSTNFFEQRKYSSSYSPGTLFSRPITLNVKLKKAIFQSNAIISIYGKQKKKKTNLSSSSTERNEKQSLHILRNGMKNEKKTKALNSKSNRPIQKTIFFFSVFCFHLLNKYLFKWMTLHYYLCDKFSYFSRWNRVAISYQLQIARINTK